MDQVKPKYNKRQPKFIKVNEISAGKHCYNVYCKIIKMTETENTNNNGETYTTVEGQVGDETGMANFLLRGEHAKGLVEGQTVALRNARSNVVQDYIRLELDRFGKLSQESVTIDKIDEENNISAIAYVLQNRR